MNNPPQFPLALFCNIVMGLAIMIALAKTEINEVKINSMVEQLKKLEGDHEIR